MLSHNDILGHEGRIAARLPNYERRPQQLEMAAAVADVLRDGGRLVVEAGTGVGKSFAYLTPAILAATDDDVPVKRVVVSTHTISLQEQLMAKDIPLLNAVIPREFTAVLAKGRRNYVSLRRLHAAAARAESLFPEDQQQTQLQQLLDWSQKTSDGSLSDLPFKPRSDVWDEAASDSGNCMGRKCPTRKECFYFRARDRVRGAQILVVNHALFFSDLALRQHDISLLPDYDAVIFDEAHTLESVAGDHLGIGVSNGQVQYILRKLYNDRNNKGLLVHHQLVAAQQLTLDCAVAADEFFQDLLNWRRGRAGANGRVTEPEIVANRLSGEMRRLAGRIRKDAKQMDVETDRQDLNSAENRLLGLADEIDAWLTQEIEDAVYWLETSERRSGPRIKLAAAPIDVGPALRSQLYQQVRSVIMTSATLATGDGKFEFFKSRVGLTECRTLGVGSPFDYRSQAKLIVVGDMADPASQQQRHLQQSVEMLKRYLARTDGRAFVLFTSYDMMRRTASALQRWLSEQNMPLHSQADGTPRSVMLREYLRNPRAVLFGADSFWQGVDVQGDALRNVIIMRLPFSVPDQPLLQARLEAIRARGGNPFSEFQLPEAIIKLRQGFGRLIRSQSDRGIVVVLDPRIRTKPYGRAFLKALPDCEVIEERFSDEGADE